MSSNVALFNSDNEVASKLSDCDIIDETPQKILRNRVNIPRKNGKHLKKSAKLPLFHLKNQKASSPNTEYQVVRNQKKITKIQFGDSNDKYTSPHVFYDIKDLARFNDHCTPFNVNMKLFGLYSQRSACIHYLLEFKRTSLKVNPLKILLNLDLVNYFPICDQSIEVYGFLKHQNVCNKNVTVFVVKFWKSISWEFNEYLNTLRSHKMLVPSCYTIVINNSNNFNITEAGKSIEESRVNFSFEEIDEISLYKNAEYIELVAREFEQMMNISEDIFK